jgi:hypothetical protein
MQVESKGKAPLFMMSKINLNLPINAYGALKVINFIYFLRKVRPPKVEGVKNSKKKKSLNATKASS